jgi:hypothetical protein
MSDVATMTNDLGRAHRLGLVEELSLPEIRRQFANAYTPGAVRFARYRLAGSIGPQSSSATGDLP